MISSVAWVPHGAVRRYPLRHELTHADIAELRKKAAREGIAVARAATTFAAKGGARSRGDGEDDGDGDADEDVDGEEVEEEAVEAAAGAMASASAAAAAAAAAGAGAEELDDLELPGGDDSSEEDEEDLEARDTDLFLLAANTDEDVSTIEVYVYNTADGALYVHHDITLPALPLCMTWADYAGATSASAMVVQCGLNEVGVTPESFVGSYVAVGTFKRSIEIWNLDVLDPLEPAVTLVGGEKAGASKKGGKKAGVAGSVGGHNDAVMGLAWNREHRHLIASSSADKTVKLWDVDTAVAAAPSSESGGGAGVTSHSAIAGASLVHKPLQTWRHHLGKVQSVAWNPVEATILATASHDRTAAVLDAREGTGAAVARYALPSDSESLVWNPHAPQAIVVSCDDGTVLQYDVRVPDTPLWNFKAHAGSCTAVAFSSLARGLVATAGLDKSVRIWDAGSAVGVDGTKPLLVASKAMSIGQIFSAAFLPQSPYMLAAGGSKGSVAIWDLLLDGGELVGAPAPSAAAMAASEAVGNAASLTARRFADRMMDAAAVPAAAVRHRPDGVISATAAAAAPAAAAAAAAGAGR